MLMAGISGLNVDGWNYRVNVDCWNLSGKCWQSEFKGYMLAVGIKAVGCNKKVNVESTTVPVFSKCHFWRQDYFLPQTAPHQ